MHEKIITILAKGEVAPAVFFTSFLCQVTFSGFLRLNWGHKKKLSRHIVMKGSASARLHLLTNNSHQQQRVSVCLPNTDTLAGFACGAHDRRNEFCSLAHTPPALGLQKASL